MPHRLNNITEFGVLVVGGEAELARSIEALFKSASPFERVQFGDRIPDTTGFDVAVVLDDGADQLDALNAVRALVIDALPVVAVGLDAERLERLRDAGATVALHGVDRNFTQLIQVLVTNERLTDDRDAIARDLRNGLRLEAIGRLAGGVAHDFNNLLTTVGCFASFVEEAVIDQGPKEDAREILRAAERGTRLTERLLSLSRDRRRRPERLRVSEVCEELQRLVAKSLGSEVRLSVDLGIDLSPILFDRSDLEQAIMHVIIQCRDRMPNGGQVILRCWQTGRHVGVEIQDDGRGLGALETDAVYADAPAPEHVEQVIALRAVRRILEQGGAVLEIESKARAGTRYRLVFDAVAALSDVMSEPQDEINTIDGRGRSIVVFDLEESVIRSAQRILEERGFLVHGVRSFSDLVGGLRSRQWSEPVCVLIDDASLGDEKLDGLRRAHPQLARIIMSGGGREHEEPFAVMLRKPFDERTLVDAVASAEQVALRAPAPGGARILIIDDDALTARSITRVLDGLCTPEHIFGERGELLQRLENDDYDLVLCDVLMPGINGMQLFEWVRARSPSIAQRFVFLTAAAEFDIIREFAESIPNPVYSKPLDRQGFEKLLASRGLL